MPKIIRRKQGISIVLLFILAVSFSSCATTNQGYVSYNNWTEDLNPSSQDVVSDWDMFDISPRMRVGGGGTMENIQEDFMGTLW